MLETLSILVWDTGCPLWSASPAAMDTLPAVLSLQYFPAKFNEPAGEKLKYWS